MISSLLLKRIHVLFQYRYLFHELVVKDIKLKYRRSFLGYLWSVLNPLLTMLVLVEVFSQLFRFDIDNFPVYLLSGQILFNFLIEATNQSLFSIWSNASLIKKVYIPKYIFTLSKVTSSLVNLLFSFVALIVVMLITDTVITWHIILVPVVILEIYVFSIGLGFFLAQASVFFKDIQYIYSVLTTAWTYLTPIFYPLSILPDGLRNNVINYNPMYFYVEQLRAITLYGTAPDFELVIRGTVCALLFLAIGAWSFFRSQNKFILYI